MSYNLYPVVIIIQLSSHSTYWVVQVIFFLRWGFMSSRVTSDSKRHGSHWMSNTLISIFQRLGLQTWAVILVISGAEDPAQSRTSCIPNKILPDKLLNCSPLTEKLCINWILSWWHFKRIIVLYFNWFDLK